MILECTTGYDLLIQIIIGKRASHPTGQHQERVKRSHSDHVQHHRGHRPGLRGPCGHQAVRGPPQPGRRLPDPPLLAAGAHEEGRGGHLGPAVPPLQVALNIFSWHSKYLLPVQTAAAGGTAAHPRHQLEPAAVGRGGEVRGHVGPHHQEDFLPRARSLLRGGRPGNRHLGGVLGELRQSGGTAIEGPRGIYQGELN